MPSFPFYEPSPHTPPLDGRAPGLAIAFADGARETELGVDEPWPVYCACVVDAAMARELGGAPHALIRVVVTHRQTGRVYVSGMSEDAVGRDSGIELETDGAELVSVKSFHNVDVRRTCGIDAEAGTYWIVAQLGRMVTDVLELRACAAGERDR